MISMENTMNDNKLYKNLGKLFYLFVFIVLVFYHFQFDLSKGDEVTFYGRILTPGSEYSIAGKTFIGTLIEFTKSGYSRWSSRNIIEIVLVIISTLPKMVWHVLDILIVLFMLRTVDKVFVIKNTAIKYSLMLLLFLSYPVSAMSSAGWIATTVNYTWVLAFGIYMFYVIFRIRAGVNVKKYVYVLSILVSVYALNNEQFNIFSLIFLGCILIYDCINKKSIKLLIPYMVINIVELIFIILCPGNSVRDETMRYLLPEANAQSGFLYNVFIGIRQIGIDIFEYSCLATIILLIVLFIVNDKKENLSKVIGIFLLMTAAYTFIRYMLLPHMGNPGLGADIRILGLFREKNYSIILLSCMLGAICLYMTSKCKDRVIIWAALVGGASTDGMLGFTVAWAISGARTALYFWAVRGLLALLLVKEFEDSFTRIDLNRSKRIALCSTLIIIAVGLFVWQLLNIPYVI